MEKYHFLTKNGIFVDGWDKTFPLFMHMMKRFFIISAILIGAVSLHLSAQDKSTVSVTYALTQTSLSFEVEAVKESFFAGPYAKYAEKFLGIKASDANSVTYRISSVRMTPYVEADAQHRYTVTLPSGAVETFTQMSTQGLVSVSEGGFGRETSWRFPGNPGADFSAKGLSANYTAEATTLYQGVKNSDNYNQVAVSQKVVVAKTAEQKAKEAADMILKLRSTRIQIITGDTDANYSGESMGAALNEIARLEKEYLSLFIGYTTSETQKMNYEFVPTDDTRNHVFVAFRLSDTAGLLSADDVSGKPYFVDIVSEGVVSVPSDDKVRKGDTVIYYRTPAICSVKLSDGSDILLETRVPVCQFGNINVYMVKK